MSRALVRSSVATGALLVGALVSPAHAVEGGALLDEGDLTSGGSRSLALVQLAAGSCSGSLVAPDLVLTAAHCEDPVSVQVDGVTRGVTEVLVAPGYSDTAFSSEHDVALLRLSAAVAAPPALLVPPPDAVQTGSDVTFAGFGTGGSLGSAAVGAGQVVGVQDRTLDVLGEAGTTGCSGDSGGPVVLGDVLVGVLSAFVDGNGDCSENLVATRVSAQADFLADFVNLAPVAVPGSATVTPGGRTTITLSARDTAGEQVRFSVVDAGALAVGKGCSSSDGGPDASVQCTVTAPRNAVPGTSVPVVFTASDGRATSTGVVDVAVVRRAKGNAAPTATDAALEVDPFGSVVFALPAFDPDGDALTARLRTQPSSGSVVCEGLDCTYSSGSDVVGLVDSFTYSVSDGKRTSGTATVTVTTVDVPTAPEFESPDRVLTGYSGVAFIDVLRVLDPQGQKVTVTAVEPTFSSAAGTVALECFNDHGAGLRQEVECVVEASPGFAGEARFDLVATDGAEQATDVLRIVVNDNRPPSITGGQLTLTPDDGFSFPLLPFPRDADPDCADAVFEIEVLNGFEGYVLCPPLVHTTSIDATGADGTFSCDTDGSCAFVPAEGATGDQVVVIRWSVSDGALSSSTVTTTVTFQLP